MKNESVFKVGDKVGKFTVTRASSRKWFVQCNCGGKEFERAESTLHNMKYRIDLAYYVHEHNKMGGEVNENEIYSSISVYRIGVNSF